MRCRSCRRPRSRNLDENALKLGHDVSADGVLYGTVERYQERVGMDYSAASPASVAFSLKFVDLKTQAGRLDREVREIAGGAVAESFRSREFRAAFRAMGARS